MSDELRAKLEAETEIMKDSIRQFLTDQLIPIVTGQITKSEQL